MEGQSLEGKGTRLPLWNSHGCHGLGLPVPVRTVRKTSQPVLSCAAPWALKTENPCTSAECKETFPTGQRDHQCSGSEGACGHQVWDVSSRKSTHEKGLMNTCGESSTAETHLIITRKSTVEKGHVSVMYSGNPLHAVPIGKYTRGFILE